MHIQYMDVLLVLLSALTSTVKHVRRCRPFIYPPQTDGN